MAIRLSKLPFARDELSSVLSSKTIDCHYGGHHRGYVDTLNKLISGTIYQNKTLEQMVRTSDGLIFNNASQVWNHEFYWNSLTPKPSEPNPMLARGIARSFGDQGSLRLKLIDKALSVFGSGWVWLVMDPQCNLAIETTLNGDSPLKTRHTPLLAIDVWEHAYYLDYQNNRVKYLRSITEVLNWDFASQGFQEITQCAAV